MAISIFFRCSVVDVLYMLNLQIYMADPGTTDLWRSFFGLQWGYLGNIWRPVEDSSLLMHRNSVFSDICECLGKKKKK